MIDGEPLRAKRYLIASGASPAVPAVGGLEEAGYLTSTTALELTELPRRLEQKQLSLADMAHADVHEQIVIVPVGEEVRQPIGGIVMRHRLVCSTGSFPKQ